MNVFFWLEKQHEEERNEEELVAVSSLSSERLGKILHYIAIVLSIADEEHGSDVAQNLSSH